MPKTTPPEPVYQLILRALVQVPAETGDYEWMDQLDIKGSKKFIAGAAWGVSQDLDPADIARPYTSKLKKSKRKKSKAEKAGEKIGERVGVALLDSIFGDAKTVANMGPFEDIINSLNPMQGKKPKAKGKRKKEASGKLMEDINRNIMQPDGLGPLSERLQGPQDSVN